VQKDPIMKRDGLNIITKHYLTITEAILGTNISVKTVSGQHMLEVKNGAFTGQ
jgi:DnaJ-class molecular chaperone